MYWIDRLVCLLFGHDGYEVPHRAGCYRSDHRNLPSGRWCLRCEGFLGEADSPGAS